MPISATILLFHRPLRTRRCIVRALCPAIVAPELIRESNIRTVVNENRDHRRDKIVHGIVYTFELSARPVKTKLINCEVLLWSTIVK